jgi:Domain of unknown function (DUF4340)
MSRKAFTILVVAALAFVILAIVGQRPSNTKSVAGDSVGSLLFPDLTEHLDDIDEVLVDGAGRKRLVSLERSDDGWTVSELDGYEADRSKVNSLLIALADARIVEEKTADPEFHSKLGVEDVAGPDAAGIEVGLVAGDGNRFSVVLGSTYSGGQRYARIADNDLSVLIDQDPNVAKDPSDWVVPEIIDIAGDRIQRVEISHADGEHIVLHKEARGETNFTVDDIPEGRELQYAGVANATGNLLQHLRLDAVRRRSDEAAEPVAVTEFWTFDGLVITVNATAVADEDPWLGFSARFDADQALAYAPPPSDTSAAADGDAADAGAAEVDATESGSANSDAADNGSTESGPAGTATDDSEPEADVAAEADSINARLADWQYRVASYQMSQLTRRMEDLLRPEADDE